MLMITNRHAKQICCTACIHVTFEQGFAKELALSQLSRYDLQEKSPLHFTMHNVQWQNEVTNYLIDQIPIKIYLSYKVHQDIVEKTIRVNECQQKCL